MVSTRAWTQPSAPAEPKFEHFGRGSGDLLGILQLGLETGGAIEWAAVIVVTVNREARPGAQIEKSQAGKLVTVASDQRQIERRSDGVGQDAVADPAETKAQES